jgi:(2Fe-2S) ferredoxin
MSFYNKHVFFCTNQKDNNKKCCAEADATAMWQYAKARCKQEGLLANDNVRVSKAGCLGRCSVGPCIVVYPEGLWYTYRNQADIDKFIEGELMDNERVEDLLIKGEG